MPSVPTEVTQDLPTGFDRADGGGGRLGTPTPGDAVLVQSTEGTTIPLEESPSSPTIERAEQATFSKEFTMSWEDGLTRIAATSRGNIETDTYNQKFLVLSASLQHQKGGTAVLRKVLESKSFDSPPDEFEIVPVELGLSIIKHPRYFYAFLGSGYGESDELVNQCVIRLLQDYMANANINYRNAAQQLLIDSMGTQGSPGDPQPEWDGKKKTWTVGTIPGTDLAKAAALEIIQKYWRGIETPYIVGWQITWSRYFFRPPEIHPGGVIQNPITEASPQLPDYFWSTTSPPDPDHSIFDSMILWNPQCYSDNGDTDGNLSIAWLRKADTIEYQRTWFKQHMTWIGTPIGHWDEEIYSSGARPVVADDYLGINETPRV